MAVPIGSTFEFELPPDGLKSGDIVVALGKDNDDEYTVYTASMYNGRIWTSSITEVTINGNTLSVFFNGYGNYIKGAYILGPNH